MVQVLVRVDAETAADGVAGALADGLWESAIEAFVSAGC
jgi:hypothetical protein